jgi:hypothetical protein
VLAFSFYLETVRRIEKELGGKIEELEVFRKTLNALGTASSTIFDWTSNGEALHDYVE